MSYKAPLLICDSVFFHNATTAIKTAITELNNVLQFKQNDDNVFIEISNDTIHIIKNLLSDIRITGRYGDMERLCDSYLVSALEGKWNDDNDEIEAITFQNQFGENIYFANAKYQEYEF